MRERTKHRFDITIRSRIYIRVKKSTCFHTMCVVNTFLSSPEMFLQSHFYCWVWRKATRCGGNDFFLLNGWKFVFEAKWKIMKGKIFTENFETGNKNCEKFVDLLRKFEIPLLKVFAISEDLLSWTLQQSFASTRNSFSRFDSKKLHKQHFLLQSVNAEMWKFWLKYTFWGYFPIIFINL